MKLFDSNIMKLFDSVAEGLNLRFYSDRVITIACLDSTPTLVVHVVASLVKVFTMIISAWWLRTSNKLSNKKTKKQPERSQRNQMDYVKTNQDENFHLGLVFT